MNESFGSNANSSRSAHIAEMNQIYDDDELLEALKATDDIIMSVRARKDELFHELAKDICEGAPV